jgi:hypothetical protein
VSRGRLFVSGGGNSINIGVPASGSLYYVKESSNGNDVVIGTPGPPGPAGEPGAGVEEEMLDTEIDQTNPLVVYVGQAQPGTAKSAALWRIKRITESGTETSIDWAGGSADFVNVWDNRTSLSYGP